MKNIVAGILAHVDAGKTTLSEAVLYMSGAIRSAGRVDNGNSFLDNFYLERQRGITIFSKQAGIRWNETSVTILDTPGHVDFSAEMERTLSVIDYGILIVSGFESLANQTVNLFRLLKRYNKPVFIFVNKMDMALSDKAVIYDEIRNKLSKDCVDFTDLNLEETKESIASCSEKIMDKYLSSGEIEKEDIAESIKNREIFPCFFGSALKIQGVKEFMDGFTEFARADNYSDINSGIIYKISRDDKNNRLTHLRVMGGRIKVKDTLEIYGEKINQIRFYNGDKFEIRDFAMPGEICVITGITKSKAGDMFGNVPDNAVKNILEPFMSYELKFDDKVNMLETVRKIRMLEEEIPEIAVMWNEITKSISIKVMGEVQTEVIKDIIKNRFDLDVEFGKGNISYKETIGNTVEGVGHFEPLRHYAEVHLLMEPLERGSGLVFDTDVSTDLLSLNWQRLILTHLKEKVHTGVLTNSPLTDMRITLVNGKSHIKHTEGGDMRQATYRALRQGLMKAESILLEPYYEFTLSVPKSTTGRAVTDLEQRGANFDITSNDGENTVIEGRGPVSTLIDYVLVVKAFTKGAGNISFKFAGYDICKNAQNIVNEINYDPVADINNSPDSVFCSHGAGTIVPWSEVENHMHLELRNKEKTSELNTLNVINRQNTREQKTGYEADAELLEIFNRTYKSANVSNKSKGSKKIEERIKPVKPYEYKPVKHKDKYLLVDGYNVIFAWKELRELAQVNIDSARDKLIEIMSNYQGYKKIHMMIVFDAYKVRGFGGEQKNFGNVCVVFTKEACTADRYIEKFAHDYGKKYDITVATSDSVEQVIILGQGCNLISSREFEKEVEITNIQIRENLEEIKKSLKNGISIETED